MQKNLDLVKSNSDNFICFQKRYVWSKNYNKLILDIYENKDLENFIFSKKKIN